MEWPRVDTQAEKNRQIKSVTPKRKQIFLVNIFP
jgi:hypothetical protein